MKKLISAVVLSLCAGSALAQNPPAPQPAAQPPAPAPAAETVAPPAEEAPRVIRWETCDRAKTDIKDSWDENWDESSFSSNVTEFRSKCAKRADVAKWLEDYVSQAKTRPVYQNYQNLMEANRKALAQISSLGNEIKDLKAQLEETKQRLGRKSEEVRKKELQLRQKEEDLAKAYDAVATVLDKSIKELAGPVDPEKDKPMKRVFDTGMRSIQGYFDQIALRLNQLDVDFPGENTPETLKAEWRSQYDGLKAAFEKAKTFWNGNRQSVSGINDKLAKQVKEYNLKTINTVNQMISATTQKFNEMDGRRKTSLDRPPTMWQKVKRFFQKLF